MCGKLLGEIMKTIGVKPAVLLVSLVLGISTVTGCGQPETVQELIASAQQSIDKRDNNAAVIALKNALTQEPGNAQARAMLGKVYLEVGDLEAAARELAKAESQGADKGMIMPLLAHLLVAQGKFDEALSKTSTNEQFSADSNVKIYIQHGSAYTALRQYEQAREVLQKAKAIQPNTADIYYGMAVLAVAQQADAEAFAQLDTALAKNAHHIEALLLKGYLLRSAGKRGEAMAVYRKVTEIDAKNVAAMVSITSLLLDEGKLDQARDQIELAARRVSKSLIVKYYKAMVDYRQSKLAEADAGVQEVLKYAPDHQQALLLSGLIQGARGSFEIAEARFNRVLALDPNNLFAKKRLIAIQLQRKQPDQAIKQINELLATAPKDPELLALAGQAYMEKKQLDKATEYFERTSAINPQSAVVRTQLAMIELAKGNLKEGISDLEQAAAMDQATPQTDALLILSTMRTGDYPRALKAAEAALRKQPKNAVLLNLKAGAYLGMKDHINARKSLEAALAIDPLYLSAVVNLAKLDLLDKKPEAARKRFETVLDKDENNISAMLALAELAQTERKLDEAIDWLKKATKAKPDVVQPWQQLVRAYLQNKQPDKAVRIAEEAQKKHADSPIALDLLASAQMANKQVDAAIASYNKMIKLAPTSPIPYFKLAGVYAQKNDLSSARNALTKALQVQPNYLDAEIALIQLEVSQKNYAAALQTAKAIQRQYPKVAVGYAVQGDILMTQNQPQQAVNAYQEASRHGHNSDLLIKTHAAMTRSGQGAKADAMLAQWLKANPRDSKAVLYQADLKLAKGNYNEATTGYRELLKIDPNNVLVLNNLAVALQQANDPTAERVAQKAYELAPKSAAVIDTLGWIKVQRSGAAAGLELLKQASTLAPSNPEIRYHYAYALAKTGKKDEARKLLQALLSEPSGFKDSAAAKVLLQQL